MEISQNSSKDQMLYFVKAQGKKFAAEVCCVVNSDPLSSFECAESGSVDALIADLRENSKAVIWNAITELSPEIDEDDLDADDDDEEDED